MTSPRLRSTAALALGAFLTLSACTGGGGEDRAPDEVLSAAKSELDDTSGVEVRLSTENLPAGIDGLLNATGVGTHAPAFEGDLKVAAGGITADVAVVAVGGEVHAKLPFTTKFVEIAAADYNAPDPAALMEPEDGLSSLLTAAEDVEEGDQTRRGEDVLTEYTGTLPGKAVTSIIPSASTEESFDASFTVDDQDRLAEAVLTGPFYPDVDDVTYTIAFDEYGTEKDITAP